MAVIEFCERDDGKEITGLQSQTATHTHFVIKRWWGSSYTMAAEAPLALVPAAGALGEV